MKLNLSREYTRKDLEYILEVLKIAFDSNTAGYVRAVDYNLGGAIMLIESDLAEKVFSDDPEKSG